MLIWQLPRHKRQPRWFKGIIDGMIKGNTKMVDDLIVETRIHPVMVNIGCEDFATIAETIKPAVPILMEIASKTICSTTYPRA